MTDLPEHVRADIERRIAEAPAPSRKSIEAVGRIAREFRISQQRKAKRTKKKDAA